MKNAFLPTPAFLDCRQNIEKTDPLIPTDSYLFLFLPIPTYSYSYLFLHIPIPTSSYLFLFLPTPTYSYLFLPPPGRLPGR